MDRELRALKVRALKQRLDFGEGHFDSCEVSSAEVDLDLGTLEKLTWADIDKLWPIKVAT